MERAAAPALPLGRVARGRVRFPCVPTAPGRALRRGIVGCPVADMLGLTARQ